MESQPYEVFSLNLHRNVVRNRIPVNGTMEISRRCPLECLHCYNNLPMGDRQAQLSELSYEETCRILDEISEAGCLWLLFTGGEIFARKDFLDIYTYAKKKGLIITLFTNGTLISPRIADYLLEWPPFAIEITLYGRTRETYEKLTRIPGSYDRCMRGIQLLLERGLPLKLKTVALSITKNEIWEMKKFADELGVEFKFDGMINPRIDCSQSPLEVRLQPHEVVEFDLQDSQRAEDWQKYAEQCSEAPRAVNKDEVYHCGGGISSFAIDPYGKMSICVLSQQEMYDLRKGTFKEAWESFLYKVRHKKRTLPTKCVECGLKEICSMCPASAELENGHPEKPVDFFCHVAHLRAYLFRMKVPPHGECEYCPGGDRYQNLLESVARLDKRKSETTENERIVLSQPALSSCGSGGCSSCGSGVPASRS